MIRLAFDTRLTFFARITYSFVFYSTDFSRNMYIFFISSLVGVFIFQAFYAHK